MYIMTCLSERVRKGAFQHLVTRDVPVKYIYLLMDMSVQARGCPRTRVGFRGQPVGSVLSAPRQSQRCELRWLRTVSLPAEPSRPNMYDTLYF